MPDPNKQQGPFLSTPLLLGLVALLVLLDQLSKHLSVYYLTEGQPFTVFPGFDLLLAYNSGAAFSFLSDAGGWQRWFLSAVSLLVSAFIVVWLWRLPKSQTLLVLALSFILGGALGNLYDRVVLGQVVDFISLYYGTYRFATFNIADAAISIGALLMIIDVFYNKDKPLE